MYLVNLTKGEDEPSLEYCVHSALDWAVGVDKARVIGFEILGLLKKEVRYPPEKAIDVMGRIIIGWLTKEASAPIDRIVFYVANPDVRKQLTKALKDLAIEITSTGGFSSVDIGCLQKRFPDFVNSPASKRTYP